MPVLQKLVKIGTPQQAKHAIRCIYAICRNSSAIFVQIFEVGMCLVCAMYI